MKVLVYEYRGCTCSTIDQGIELNGSVIFKNCSIRINNAFMCNCNCGKSMFTRSVGKYNYTHNTRINREIHKDNILTIKNNLIYYKIYLDTSI